MSFIFGIILMLVIFFLLCTISVSIFVFSGYVLTQLVDLTIFEATVVCIGASFVAGFLIALFKISDFLTKLPKKIPDDYIDENDEDYDDDDEDEDEEEETVRTRRNRFKVVRSNKVGRNAPCPCGSGKKYKHCCGG